MKFLTAVALAAVMLGVPVDGIAQRNPLTSLTAIQHHLVIVDWSDGIRMSEAQFTQELENAFELGLLRTGITVEEGGGGGAALLCEVNLISGTRSDLYAAAVNVTLMEGVVLASAAISGDALSFMEDVHIAETWRESQVGLVPPNSLSGTDIGEWCAEAFELEWRRANN